MKFPIFAALRPAAALIALSIATAAGRLSAASSTAPVAVPPPPPQSPNQNAQGFGAPVAGLNITLSADFVDGQDEFKIVRTPATGLGPIYNNVSCEACHNRPTVGGWGTITTTRFGRTASYGTFDPLTQQDGSLLHAYTTIAALQETLPPDANTTAKRLTTPLYGAGLIDAIPDETIEANQTIPKPPGISGRAAMVPDVTAGVDRVGRFGWKAQHASIVVFVGDAFNSEMGITNQVYPAPHAPDGNTTLFDELAPDLTGIKDSVDPVTGLSGVQMLDRYLLGLAPPGRGRATAHSARGGQVFATMQTGPSPIAALSNQNVPLFSDLLIHDMGSLGDGIAQGDAGPREMRTSPLWGLRTRTVFLHDGRAVTLNEAILDHDGEAAGTRESYSKLGGADREALMEFLNTL
jgi:CxxC motif-containing protein (DUF1111 family)